MSEENGNMDLWESWCHTDPAITKQFSGKGGFRGTAIDAQHQIKLATEQWGPMGGKWGLKCEQWGHFIARSETNDSGHIVFAKMEYQAMLYYPGGEMPISSDIDLFSDREFKRPNNDIRKKVSTDALTKGLSRLGMNSDVFEGKFDDNKYVQEMKESFANKDSAGRPTAAATNVPEAMSPDEIPNLGEGMFT